MSIAKLLKRSRKAVAAVTATTCQCLYCAHGAGQDWTSQQIAKGAAELKVREDAEAKRKRLADLVHMFERHAASQSNGLYHSHLHPPSYISIPASTSVELANYLEELIK